MLQIDRQRYHELQKKSFNEMTDEELDFYKYMFRLDEDMNEPDCDPCGDL